MNDNTIDLGVWNCPRSWKQLTLKQYQEIERYYADKTDEQVDVREIMHILFNKTQDEIDALPIDVFERLLRELKWLSDKPQFDEPRAYVYINDVRYTVNVVEKLKAGEYIAVDTAIKADRHNYAAILAILCRKEGEIYDSKFENEVLPSRIEMFEQIPVVDVMPIVSFFLQLWMTSAQLSQLSSMAKEAINLTQQSIESSSKNGVLQRLYMRWLKVKLKRLMRSIKSI